MDQVHAISCVVSPASFIGVVPQRPDLEEIHTDISRDTKILLLRA